MKLLLCLSLVGCAAAPLETQTYESRTCELGHATCAGLATGMTPAEAVAVWPMLSRPAAQGPDGPHRRTYADDDGRELVVHFAYHSVPALVFADGRLHGWPHRVAGAPLSEIFASDLRARRGAPRRTHVFRSLADAGAYRVELWFYDAGEPPYLLALQHVFDEALGRAVPEAEARVLGVTVGLAGL